MNRFFSLWILLSLCLVGCKPAPAPALQPRTAYIDAKIYTLDAKKPWAESMIVDNGEIVAVGSRAEIRKLLRKNDELIGLQGQLVLPGLHDVHVHALESGSENTHFVIRPEMSTIDLQESLRAASEEFPETDWLVGYGCSLEQVLALPENPRTILDEVVSERPVILMEVSSHSMWVNSKALELAGIGRDTPNSPGGIILRDRLGEPNGLLVDNAGNMVMDLALASTPESLESDYRTLKDITLPKLASFGITSISEARTYWLREHHKVWQRLQRESQLTCRVALGLWIYPHLDDEEQLAAIRELYDDSTESLLKINQIKLYSDGITHNTTAALKEKYLHNALGLEPDRGLNYISARRLTSLIKHLEPVGFDFHIHAIGDRAVQEALDSIENGATSAGRHRLTHVEMVDKADLARFKELDVTADCQVAGRFTQPEFWSDHEHLLGPERGKDLVPLKSLKESGARVTLSSDWNVSDLNPMVGLQNAVTRAPQNLSLEDSIQAYTLNAAYVMRQEDRVGSLEPGKRADFIVLDQDLFEIPATEISKTKVLLTVMDGRVVHKEL